MPGANDLFAGQGNAAAVWQYVFPAKQLTQLTYIRISRCERKLSTADLQCLACSCTAVQILVHYQPYSHRSNTLTPLQSLSALTRFTFSADDDTACCALTVLTSLQKLQLLCTHMIYNLIPVRSVSQLTCLRMLTCLENKGLRASDASSDLQTCLPHKPPPAAVSAADSDGPSMQDLCGAQAFWCAINQMGHTACSLLLLLHMAPLLRASHLTANVIALNRVCWCISWLSCGLGGRHAQAVCDPLEGRTFDW